MSSQTGPETQGKSWANFEINLTTFRTVRPRERANELRGLKFNLNMSIKTGRITFHLYGG